MTIEYEQDAVDLATLILERLRGLDLDGHVEEAEQLQERIEQGILNSMQSARREVEAGDAAKALRLLLPANTTFDFNGNELSRQDLLNFVAQSPARVEQMLDVLNKVLFALAPNDVFTPTTP